MIYQKGRVQNGESTAGEQHIDCRPSHGILEIPDDASHWLPEPEHHDHRNIGKQYVRAPFDWLRNELVPPLFERRPSHYRVLDSKDCQQQAVHQECHNQRSLPRRVQRRRGTKISNEFDGV